MSEFSAWQDVLVELARIRGWLECWESTGPHRDEKDAAIMRDRLARIEKLKPCGHCGGKGEYINFEGHTRDCDPCNGSGIES